MNTKTVGLVLALVVALSVTITLFATGTIPAFLSPKTNPTTTTTTNTTKTTTPINKLQSVENVFFVSNTNSSVYVRGSGNFTIQWYWKDPNANYCSGSSAVQFPNSNVTSFSTILQSSCSMSQFVSGYQYTLTLSSSYGTFSTTWVR